MGIRCKPGKEGDDEDDANQVLNSEDDADVDADEVGSGQ